MYSLKNSDSVKTIRIWGLQF